jgi:hypothetical protein
MNNLVKKTKSKVKKSRDAGIIGIVTVIVQLLLGHKSDLNVSGEFEKVRRELVDLRIERERDYAKKVDITKEFERVKDIQYQMKSDIVYVSHQVIDLKNLIKKQDKNISFAMKGSSCYAETTILKEPLSFSQTSYYPKQVQRKKMLLPGHEL